MDWQLFIFNPEYDWLNKFDLMARKRFNHDDLAQAAVNDIIKELSKENWSILGDIKSKNEPGAYLTTVFRRKLEDMARQRYGRPRPPVWLQKLGGFWLTLFQWLCLERKSRTAIFDAIEQHQNQEDVDNMILTIKTKHPKCGSPDCKEDSLEEHQEINQGFEPVYEDNDCSCDEQLLLALGHYTGINDEDALKPMQFGANFSSLRLSDEEQVMLKLIYQQGLKISQVARMLHIPDHQVRKSHQNTLDKIKECLNVRQ
ncbi:MAG: hypothetical protein R3E90_06220 [Marinicella sp.]